MSSSIRTPLEIHAPLPQYAPNFLHKGIPPHPDLVDGCPNYFAGLEKAVSLPNPPLRPQSFPSTTMSFVSSPQLAPLQTLRFKQAEQHSYGLSGGSPAAPPSPILSSTSPYSPAGTSTHSRKRMRLYVTTGHVSDESNGIERLVKRRRTKAVPAYQFHYRDRISHSHPASSAVKKTDPSLTNTRNPISNSIFALTEWPQSLARSQFTDHQSFVSSPDSHMSPLQSQSRHQFYFAHKNSQPFTFNSQCTSKGSNPPTHSVFPVVAMLSPPCMKRGYEETIDGAAY